MNDWQGQQGYKRRSLVPQIFPERKTPVTFRSGKNQCPECGDTDAESEKEQDILCVYRITVNAHEIKEMNTSSQYLYNDLRKMVRWAREFMPHGILLEKGGTQR